MCFCPRVRCRSERRGPSGDDKCIASRLHTGALAHHAPERSLERARALIEYIYQERDFGGIMQKGTRKVEKERWPSSAFTKFHFGTRVTALRARRCGQSRGLCSLCAFAYAFVNLLWQCLLLGLHARFCIAYRPQVRASATARTQPPAAHRSHPTCVRPRTSVGVTLRE